jgi:hypothetical protein
LGIRQQEFKRLHSVGHILYFSDHKQYRFRVPAPSVIVWECPADIYDQLNYPQEKCNAALYIFLIFMHGMDVGGSHCPNDTKNCRF